MVRKETSSLTLTSASYNQINKCQQVSLYIRTLLADLLRDRLEGIIDISPFGSAVLVPFNPFGRMLSHEDIARALKSTLEEIVNNIQFEIIQGVSAVQCGKPRPLIIWRERIRKQV